jgi:hypothetical protein
VLTGLLLALYHEVDGLLVAEYHAVVVRQCYGNALRSGCVRRRCRNVLRLAGRLLLALVAVAKDLARMAFASVAPGNSHGLLPLLF